MFVLNECKSMQHLSVNFGGIWRFELCFFICFLGFLLQKCGLISKSSGNTTAQSAVSLRHVVNTHYLSILIRDHCDASKHHS